MTFYKIIYKNTSIPFLLTKNDLLFDFIKKIFLFDLRKSFWTLKNYLDA